MKYLIRALTRSNCLASRTTTSCHSATRSGKCRSPSQASRFRPVESTSILVGARISLRADVLLCMNSYSTTTTVVLGVDILTTAKLLSKLTRSKSTIFPTLSTSYYRVHFSILWFNVFEYSWSLSDWDLARQIVAVQSQYWVMSSPAFNRLALVAYAAALFW